MIEVLNPGFFSTIQDLGRFSSVALGVPISGAMDSNSAKLANILLENSEDCAVLEMTMTGAKLRFDVPSMICISGADMQPLLDDIAISMYHPICVLKGQVLTFGRIKNGIRTYLAVKHGFMTELIMNSRSIYKGITNNWVIRKNDVLPIQDHEQVKPFNTNLNYNTLPQTSRLKVFKGPEFEHLSEKQINYFLVNSLTVSKYNNRMGYQLEELLQNDLQSIITSPVIPGTVQLTPSGNLIILMRDCQTTGGYPRILQLTEESINALSQKYVGQKFSFVLVDQ